MLLFGVHIAFFLFHVFSLFLMRQKLKFRSKGARCERDREKGQQQQKKECIN